MLEYCIKYQDQIMDALMEHIHITLTAVVISVLIAFPIGFLISRWRRLSGLINGICNVIFSIPTLALLVILIPFTGLGSTTAIVTLILYNQYLLIKNIEEGFNEVNPRVKESAMGMGMSRWQVFYKIEIPLALPMILSGLKLATSGTIAMATLGATVGAGGLGRLILMGMTMQHWEKVIVGTVLSALLALLATVVFQLLENFSLRRARGEG